MAASTYASMGGRIKELIGFLFRRCMATVTLVNGGFFLELTLEWNRRNTESFREYDLTSYLRGHHFLSMIAGT